MNFLEYVIWFVLGYLLLVLTIETIVWRFQPPMEGALTLVISSESDSRMERRLDSFEYEGTLYVSSNHWFRSWYKAALANPNVMVSRNGESPTPYGAEPVSGAQHNTLSKAYKMGFALRALCGFAPSKFVKLSPNHSPD